MSPLDRPVPPAGEEIHLPGGSLQPLMLAVGVTVALLGVTAGLPFIVAGCLLALFTLVRWVQDVRRDVDELPAHHDVH